MADGNLHRLLLGPGDRVGRYEIVAEVAQGGMATVYVARLTSIGGFGKLFALKVLLPHLRSDRAFVNMLLDEARIAASIHHPNVVQVIDIADHEGTPYIAMELLRGRSLARMYLQARRASEPIPAGTVLSILARAAEGLHAAHEARDETGAPLGIVHRDVSPQNIHVGYDGHVKVVDFGIAAAAGRLTETTHGVVKGKAEYLAPEQLSRKRGLDRRTDVWALGVMAFEMLAGRRLFKGEDFTTTMWNVLNREVPRLRELAPRMPREVDRIVAAALDREMDRRPASCEELMRVFDAAAAELGGASKADIAQLMSRLFTTDRAVEEERIAAALRDGPPPPFEGEIDEEAPTVDERAATTPRRGRSVIYAAVGVVAMGLAIAAYATVGGASSPRETDLPSIASTPAEESASAEARDPDGPMPDPPPGAGDEQPVEPTLAQASPARTTRVEIAVDPRARLVLADGERRDERPLDLEVPEGGTVTVELVAPNGRLFTHEISADDSGRTLSLPSRRSTRPQRDPRPTPPEMSMEAPSREIVRDVF